MKRLRKTAALLLSAVLLFSGCCGTGNAKENKPGGNMSGVITVDDLPENTGNTQFLTHVYKSAGVRCGNRDPDVRSLGQRDK